MNSPLRIIVGIEPVAKGRPRVTFHSGRVWTFTPEKTENFQNELQARVMRHSDKIIHKPTPIKLTVTFYRKKSEWRAKGEELPVCRPDLNNILSATLDALNGVLWDDDSQICTVNMRKRWSKKEGGYITIRVECDSL
jgi:Holliday junction resolvase RusA-like endonuclease